MTEILSALSLGILLAFLLGPVFFAVIETSISKGIRHALFLDLGVITADIIFILIAYFSTNQLLTKLKDDPAWSIFGGVLLLAYGIISLFNTYKFSKHQKKKKQNFKVSKKGIFGSFVKGFFLNFINVGVLLFWVGVLLFIGPKLSNNPPDLIFFLLTVLLTYFAVDLVKIIVAKKLQKKLTSKNIYKVKQLINMLMIVFGLFFLLSAFIPKASQYPTTVKEWKGN